MISSKLSVLLPCSAFFTEGRIFAGTMALLMQLTLILWPVAARWARSTGQQTGMEKKLAELSETHRVHVDPYAKQPEKKFRQLA